MLDHLQNAFALFVRIDPSLVERVSILSSATLVFRDAVSQAELRWQVDLLISHLDQE